MAKSPNASTLESLSELVQGGLTLCDSSSSSSPRSTWAQHQDFRRGVHHFLRVFYDELPDQAARVWEFSFVTFTSYDDLTAEEIDDLPPEADDVYENGAPGKLCFNRAEIRVAVNWLTVLLDRAKLKSGDRPSIKISAREQGRKVKKRRGRNQTTSVRSGRKRPARDGNSVAFSADELKNARNGLNFTQERAAEWFGVTARQYKRWESGNQRGMHRPNHGNLQIFVNCERQHIELPLRRDTQMSPSADTENSR